MEVWSGFKAAELPSRPKPRPSKGAVSMLFSAGWTEQITYRDTADFHDRGGKASKLPGMLCVVLNCESQMTQRSRMKTLCWGTTPQWFVCCKQVGVVRFQWGLCTHGGGSQGRSDSLILAWLEGGGWAPGHRKRWQGGIHIWLILCYNLLKQLHRTPGTFPRVLSSLGGHHGDDKNI